MDGQARAGTSDAERQQIYEGNARRLAAQATRPEGVLLLDSGPALDPEAKAAYRQRLEGLREDLTEAESFNDPERAAAARGT